MHFRICCCCNEEEKGKTETVGVSSQPTVPVVVSEQPKPVETIQLDKITEVSVEESSVEAVKEEAPAPIVRSSIHEPTNVIESLAPTQQSTSDVTRFNPPTTQPFPFDNSRSNLNFTSNIGDELVTFDQVGPGHFSGTYKAAQFTVRNDQFQSTDGTYTYEEKDAIMTIYSRAMIGLQRGIGGLEASLLATMPSTDGQQYTPMAGNNINVNYLTRSGEKAIMTFVVVGRGHFRTTYKGKEFTILNGRVFTTDGVADYLDTELILNNYFMAMMGMQRGLLGMHNGMLGTSASFMPMNVTQSQYNVLATGQDSLQRMRSLNLGKRVSVLQGEVIAQPRQPVIVIEDVTESSNKPNFSDEVDGREISNIPEPVLKKTTFIPQAIIYEDPKTYEKLDKDELPNAKLLDEYIISMDESVGTGNTYYFHAAKTRRVPRKQLSPKEQLRIASSDRYSLFETECVKVHNEYRKMHGVPPLVNNEFLCEVAREWAEHLALKDAFYHRPNNEYGENLYYADGMPVCAKKAVTAWYDEINLYDYNNPKFSKETGHFTQLVWKDTREVGTGVAQIGDKVWVCCNYHPRGNYTNKFNDEFVPRPVIKR